MPRLKTRQSTAKHLLAMIKWALSGEGAGKRLAVFQTSRWLSILHAFLEEREMVLIRGGNDGTHS